MKKAISYFILSLFLLVSVNDVLGQAIPETALKKNIESIIDPGKVILQLKPKSFLFNTVDYKQLNLPEDYQYGFLADDVKSLMPNSLEQKSITIPSGKNQMRSISMTEVKTEKLIPWIVAFIQEQDARIKELEAELRDLKSRSTAIESSSR
jgi:hypothetical protein